jgi:hypothetical protein
MCLGWCRAGNVHIPILAITIGYGDSVSASGTVNGAAFFLLGVRVRCECECGVELVSGDTRIDVPAAADEAVDGVVGTLNMII